MLSLGIAGCGPDDATGSDDAPTGVLPVLGIAPYPRSVPPPQPSDLVAAVDSTIAIGARGIVQTFPWSALEPDSARLNVQKLIDDVRYARSRGLTVLLGIQTINTVKREVPADLATVPWDDVRMMRRFERLLDALQPVLGEITYLTVGNEVAGYLGRAAEWPAYTRFLTQVVAATRRRAPRVKVGATLEYVDAATQTANTRALIAVGDVAIFTLYPFNLGGFTVAPPTIAGTLFDNMLVLAGDKPVVLQELGFPASAMNGSSDALQAAFFTEAIAAWRARSNRMPFVSLFMLHDFSAQQCADLSAYYNLPNQPTFTSFLCTLGLRTADGTPRAAWSAVRTATGWLRTP